MFGEYLISKNLITEKMLSEALEVQEFSRQKIGRVLKSLSYIDEKSLDLALVEFLKIEKETSLLNSDTKSQEKIDLDNKTIGFFNKETKTLLLSSFSDSALQLLEKKYDFKIIKIVTPEQLNYLRSQNLVKERKEEAIEVTATSGPFKKLLKDVFNEAKNTKASDIHFDVEEDGLSIRLRIHGDLREIKRVEKSHVQALMTKVRSEVGLPLSVVGRPASGSTFLKDHGIKVRSEYAPESLGETVVCRIIDLEKIKQASLQTIDADEIFLKTLKKSISRKNGLILLCGQTGSGKSLTLFSSLMSLDRKQKKIITIEDPVEYEGEGLTQIDVNKNKLSFSDALRSSLRLDPDIIMVGEIRDEETANLAMRAASTGHLVLSTLHTNSALGAITRLFGMGVKDDVLLENIIQISALTLKKKLCPYCKVEINEWEDEEVKAEFLSLISEDVMFYKENKEGCENCNQGIVGRKLLTETIDSDIVYAKLKNEKSSSFRTLIDCGKEHASLGIISPFEVVGL